MEHSYGDWQPGHLRLHAPALYLLLNGPSANSKEVFKLGLRELVGRGLLRPATLQQGSGKKTTRTGVLLGGVAPTGDQERSLRSILDAWSAASPRTAVEGGSGVTVANLAGTLRSRHDGKLSKWVEDEVLAVLVERGLYTREEYKRLWIIPATRYEPTREGKAARALLEESVARTTSEFPGWASNEPARAATFLALAGPAVLLMPELQPAISRFRRSLDGDAVPLAMDTDGIEDRDDREFDGDVLDSFKSDLESVSNDIDYNSIESDSGSDSDSDGGGGDGGGSD